MCASPARTRAYLGRTGRSLQPPSNIHTDYLLCGADLEGNPPWLVSASTELQLPQPAFLRLSLALASEEGGIATAVFESTEQISVLKRTSRQQKSKLQVLACRLAPKLENGTLTELWRSLPMHFSMSYNWK